MPPRGRLPARAPRWLPPCPPRSPSLSPPLRPRRLSPPRPACSAAELIGSSARGFIYFCWLPGPGLWKGTRETRGREGRGQPPAQMRLAAGKTLSRWKSALGFSKGGWGWFTLTVQLWSSQTPSAGGGDAGEGGQRGNPPGRAKKCEDSVEAGLLF